MATKSNRINNEMRYLEVEQTLGKNYKFHFVLSECEASVGSSSKHAQETDG